MTHILAVDDSKVIRLMVQSTLEKEGHTVTTAENGSEALNFARDNSGSDHIRFKHAGYEQNDQ